jgi:3-phenylpropionate/cinnamic acid dioxygenase small subunit
MLFVAFERLPRFQAALGPQKGQHREHGGITEDTNDNRSTEFAMITRSDAEELLAREGWLLDTRQWDAWLNLYTEDAVYWAPAWKSEAEPTEDPQSELSLIYYEDRSWLQDRAWRNASGLSVAATPLWRTAHAVHNVLLVEPAREGEAQVRASFTVHCFDPATTQQHVYFGLYEITLREVGDAWRIARKKILLLNDYIPTVLDVYML